MYFFCLEVFQSRTAKCVIQWNLFNQFYHFYVFLLKASEDLL